MLGTLGIYLDDGAECTLIKTSTQICSEELLYQMALLPFGRTSVDWNLMKVQRKCKALCRGGDQPQEPVSTHCDRG